MHLAFWLGQIVCHYVLCLAQGAHAFSPDLAGWLQAAEVLAEIFSDNMVSTVSLVQATVEGIYAAFKSTGPFQR